jgi:hypothetical protein
MFNWWWSQRQHKSWEAKRAQGALRGVIVYALTWGGAMFVVNSVGPAVFGFPYKVNLSPWFWWVQTGIWAGMGLLYGFFVWCFNEKSYNRACAQPGLTRHAD